MLFLDILIGFIITYGIGLIPPIILRYIWIKKPMERNAAITTAVVFGLVNIVISTLIKGEAASPFPIFIIGSISAAILTAEQTLKKESKDNDSKIKKPFNLERLYKITGNTSIILSIVGFISGVLVGFEAKNLFTDVIVSVIYNFPRFYYGLKLKKQNITTINTAIKISKGMFIYSTIIALLNLLIFFSGSYNALYSGWFYYILIFLYFRSYKKSQEYAKDKNLFANETIKDTTSTLVESKSTLNKGKLIFLVISILGIFAGFIGGRILRNSRNICDFEISDIEISKGDNSGRIKNLYDEYEAAKLSEESWFKNINISAIETSIRDYKNFKWFKYEGIIRNNSVKEQYLLNINTKLRTDNDIFIEEGWTGNINKWLAPGEAIPFRVTVIVDSNDLIEKYIENNDYNLKVNFYPWFETCNY